MKITSWQDRIPKWPFILVTILSIIFAIYISTNNQIMQSRAFNQHCKNVADSTLALILPFKNGYEEILKDKAMPEKEKKEIIDFNASLICTYAGIAAESIDKVYDSLTDQQKELVAWMVEIVKSVKENS